MLSQVYLALILLFSSPLLSSSQTTIPVKDPKHIIFGYGSCNRPENDPKGNMFIQILKQTPDIWTWIGDAYYISGNNIENVQRISQKVYNTPGYKRLRFELPIIGIWDDHDYGPDNGGINYPYKHRNRNIFLDFIGEPLVSNRWTKPGIYESYYLGNHNLVKIILLDNRFNKEPRMSFNATKDMLGTEQWKWFEEQLTDNPAKFTIVASGIQLLPDDRVYPETWWKSMKEKVIGLIRKHKKSGVILISGDVHYAEIMEYPCKERVGYPLYEFTSSGLTHFLSGTLIADLIDTGFPNTYSKPIDRYYGKNFGIIRFNFDNAENPQAILEIRNIRGEIVLGKTLNYEDITFREDIIDMDADCKENTYRGFRFIGNLFIKIGQGNGMAITVVLLSFGVIFLCVGCYVWRFCERKKKWEYKKIAGKERKQLDIARKRLRID